MIRSITWSFGLFVGLLRKFISKMKYAIEFWFLTIKVLCTSSLISNNHDTIDVTITDGLKHVIQNLQNAKESDLCFVIL